MINYEDELQELFLNELRYRYQIDDIGTLLCYFFLKYSLYRQLKDKQETAERFLLRELNLPLDGFSYKDQQITLFRRWDNSLPNIVDNLRFMHNRQENLKGKETVKQYLSKARKRAKLYKNLPSYNDYVLYEAIQLLNEQFKVKPLSFREVEGVEYPPDHNFWARTLEEALATTLQCERNLSQSLDFITEAHLEEYLRHHLEVIEPGLTLLGNQWEIEGGRIDLLCKDREGNHVIVELKVNGDDKTLVWQSIYYPLSYRKQQPQAKVRMILLTPDYPEYILLALQTIPNLELKKYIAQLENNKIKNLKVIDIPCHFNQKLSA